MLKKTSGRCQITSPPDRYRYRIALPFIKTLALIFSFITVVAPAIELGTDLFRREAGRICVLVRGLGQGGTRHKGLGFPLDVLQLGLALPGLEQLFGGLPFLLFDLFEVQNLQSYPRV